MKTIYECPQSKGTKWITAIFFVVVIVAVSLQIYGVSNGQAVTWTIIATAILFAASLSCFFVFPMYIVADDEGIGIRTLARTIRIPYDSIARIERLDDHHQLFAYNGRIVEFTLGKFQMRLFSANNTIRLFGIGGVLGYIGWFRTKGIGTFRSYVTDPGKVFLIYRTKGLPIAISVSEPDQFMPYYLKGGTK